jgi:prepilin-type N-terminal cleavage/methylation domain-containing protein
MIHAIWPGSREGFSLLEVLISIGIFSIGILGSSVLLINTIKGNSVSQRLSTATQIASTRIEEIMLMDYASLMDGDKDGLDGLDDATTQTADGRQLNIKGGGVGERYNLYWNVAEDWPAPETKTVRVIVAWHGGTRDKRTAFDFVRTRGE